VLCGGRGAGWARVELTLYGEVAETREKLLGRVPRLAVFVGSQLYYY